MEINDDSKMDNASLDMEFSFKNVKESCQISGKKRNILIDIFGINCRTNPDPNPKNDRSDDVGLVWDVACFIVLLIHLPKEIL